MQRSIPSERISKPLSKDKIYKIADNIRDSRAKPRTKRNYTQARKLKEKGYVFS